MERLELRLGRPQDIARARCERCERAVGSASVQHLSRDTAVAALAISPDVVCTAPPPGDVKARVDREAMGSPRRGVWACAGFVSELCGLVRVLSREVIFRSRADSFGASLRDSAGFCGTDLWRSAESRGTAVRECAVLCGISCGIVRDLIAELCGFFRVFLWSCAGLCGLAFGDVRGCAGSALGSLSGLSVGVVRVCAGMRCGVVRVLPGRSRGFQRACAGFVGFVFRKRAGLCGISCGSVRDFLRGCAGLLGITVPSCHADFFGVVRVFAGFLVELCGFVRGFLRKSAGLCGTSCGIRWDASRRRAVLCGAVSRVSAG